MHKDIKKIDLNRKVASEQLVACSNAILELIDKGTKGFYIANFGVDKKYEYLGWKIFTSSNALISATLNANVSVHDIREVQYMEVPAELAKQLIFEKLKNKKVDNENTTDNIG